MKFRLLLIYSLCLLLFSCIGAGDEPWTETFLSTIDADGGNLQHLVKDVYGSPKFSHDGEKIIIANNQGFWTVNSDGTDLISILDTLIVYNNYYSVSPEEDNFIFSNSGNIYKCNYLTSLTEKVFEYEEDGALNPSYSPDGTKILFSTTRSQGDSTIVKLYVMNEDGTNQEIIYQHISESSGRIRYSLYSQDMNKIFFHVTTVAGLFMCNLDGSELEIIYSDNISDNPLVTADNFVVFRGGSEGIISFNFISHMITNLGNGQYPDISPDGTNVTFYDNDLMVMNIDGTNRSMIASSSNMVQSFSADGERIVFFGDIDHGSKREKNPLE
ncbi:MAG: hypothetical protein P9L97_00020 [Candidatus Tenebribacter davisii]|nr:hypothetical protein [Candidatus Tenebribacter davisii]